MPAEFPLRLLHHVVDEDDLDLLDVLAIQEQLNAAEKRLAAIDFDERSTGLGGLPRRGGGQQQHTECRRHRRLRFSLTASFEGHWNVSSCSQTAAIDTRTLGRKILPPLKMWGQDAGS